MKTSAFTLLLILTGFLATAQLKSQNITTLEIPVYKSKAGHKQTILSMGYASEEIQNKEAWSNKQGSIGKPGGIVFSGINIS